MHLSEIPFDVHSAHEPAMCAHSPVKPTLLWATSKAAWPAGQGGNSAPLLCFDGTPPGMLHPALESSAEDRDFLKQSRGEQWPEGWNTSPERGRGCSTWGRAGPRETLLLPFHTNVGLIRKMGTDFLLVLLRWTRGNSLKLRGQTQSRYKMRVIHLLWWVMKHCNRLPKEVIDTPSLDGVRLQAALSNPN